MLFGLLGEPFPGGVWQGTFQAKGAEVRAVIYLEDVPTGAVGTVHCPDRSGAVVPAHQVQWKRGHLHLDIPRLGAVFDGEYSGETLAGTWKQGGAATPLALRRTARLEDIPRPQTPHPPFPYREEEVQFPSAGADAKVTLAGTLTVPPGPGPHPAMVLVAGSGPSDRDEVLFRHRVFAVWADYFTRQGYAVLRYDKRGVGKSTGSFAEATTFDLRDDARGAFHYLIARPECDPRHTGILGHSEGSTLAPMIASDDPRVAFLVLVGVPGESGDEILLSQGDLAGRAAGAPESELTEQRTTGEAVDALIKREQGSPQLPGDVKDLLKTRHVPHPAIAAKFVTTPWFQSFVTTDPVPYLRLVTCPVLAVTGSLDLQVPARENLPKVEAAFEAGGNRSATVRELPGLNHLLQTAQSGSPAEYGSIPETSSPAALQVIADWLAARR